jgi:pantothenate kinase
MSGIDYEGLARTIAAVPYKGNRRVIAIAGAPASGKSTIAEELQPLIADACMVPMDGYHLDNDVLDARGLRARKGSPQTFDVAGFVALVASLKTQDDIAYPLFNRELDQAVPNAARIGSEVTTVLVEGNYLLLKDGGWDALQKYWDLSIYLDVPLDELERRLLDRWTSLGMSQTEAEAKTYGNDLLNAKTVAEESFKADQVI